MLAHAKERILISLQRPCVTLYKRTLLGPEIVKMSVLQSKYTPESMVVIGALYALFWMQRFFFDSSTAKKLMHFCPAVYFIF